MTNSNEIIWDGKNWEVLSEGKMTYTPPEMREVVHLTIARRRSNPMPEILPGDVISYDRQLRLVTSAPDDAGYFRYLDSNGWPNGWSGTAFAKHHDAKIYRDGKLIWEREK